MSGDNTKRFKEIVEGLSSRNTDQKLISIKAVGILRRPEHAEILVDLLSSPDPQVVMEALEALGQIANPRSLKHVLEFISGENQQLAERALHLLPKFDLKGSLDQVLKISSSDCPVSIRRKILNQLSFMKDSKVATLMNEVLGQSQDSALLVEALGYFIRFPSPDKHTALKMLSGNGQWEVAMSANLALSRLADESARNQIRRLAKSPAHPVRQAIVVGLNRCPMIEDRDLYEQFFMDVHPQIRLLALEGMGLFNAGERVGIFQEWLAREKEESLRLEILKKASGERNPALYPEFLKLLNSSADVIKNIGKQALVAIGEPILDRLIGDFSKQSLTIQEQILLVLGSMGQPKTRKIVLEALKAKERWVRLNAIEAILQIGHDGLSDVFSEMLKSEKDDWVLATLASALGRTGGPEHAPAIQNFLSHKDARVRANSVESLARILGPAASEVIQSFQRDPNDRVRVNSAVALWKLGDRGVMANLQGMTSDTNKWIRASAAFALGEIAEKEATPTLIEMLNDREEVVYKNVIDALAKIGDLRALVPLLKERDQKRFPSEVLQQVLERFSEKLRN